MLPVLEKNKICVFSELNDISHLLDQAFSSSRSWLITVLIFLFKLNKIFGHSKLKRVAARFAIVHHKKTYIVE
jgi:hypothetical protein